MDKAKIELPAKLRLLIEDPFDRPVDNLNEHLRGIAAMAARGMRAHEIAATFDPEITVSGVNSALGRIKKITGLDKAQLTQELIERIHDLIMFR